MAHPPLRLDDFRLEHHLGTGGMGVVWAAVHQPSALPVAIKVLKEQSSADRQARFRDEIRLIARLDHPNVLSVYDRGFVSDADAARSDGVLVADQPYLVMPIAADTMPAGLLDPARAKAALLDALSGLAHAHARGIDHLDVKPSNLLVDTAGQVTLADFGIARLRGTGGIDSTVRGSPVYMAPEQILGRWREVGPWTDLYALGCVAFLWFCGQPAYSGSLAVLRNIKQSPPPRLPVDHLALAVWVQRMMAPDPFSRFASAADAAAALAAIDVKDRVQGEQAPPDTSTLTDFDLSSASTILPMTSGETLPTPPRPPVADTLPVTRAEPPADWRLPADARQHAPPLWLGLGIVRLRTPALVGRVVERDRLWGLLKQVQASGCAQVALLQGPAGYGKSRLAQWFCERAHETGAAQILSVRYAGQTGGLWERIAHHYGVGGLPAARRGPLLVRRLGPELGHGVNAALDLAPESRDRLIWLRRLVAQAPRPTILWLDDAHLSEEALTVAHAMLQQDRCPALVVLTLQAEALAQAPATAAQVALLRDTAHVIDVGPLEPLAERQLIRELLQLPDGLAERLAHRANGNPQFAVQMVGDWVDRAVLQPTVQGTFRLNGQAPLPDDLHAVWRQRIAQLIGADHTMRDALERAAVLGMRVDTAEWVALCPGADRAAILERLLAAALAVREPGGWRFVHTMLRESLLRQAEDGGRAARHHRDAASALDALGVADPARRGRHRIAFGDRLAGAWLLLEALHDHISNGAALASAMLIDELDVVLTEEDVEETRTLTVGRGRLALNRGDFDDGYALLEPILPDLQGKMRATALQTIAACAQRQGNYDKAMGHFQASVAVWRALGLSLPQANALLGLAEVVRLSQGPEASRSFIEAAARVMPEDAPARDRAQLLYAQGWLNDDQPHKQIVMFQQALLLLRGTSMFLEGAFYNDLGRSYRLIGAYDEADGALARAERLMTLQGNASVRVVRLNRAAVALQRERPHEARQLLARLIVELDEKGWAPMLAGAQILMAQALMVLGEPASAGRWLALGLSLLEETGFVELSLIEPLERLGEGLGGARGLAALEAALRMHRAYDHTAEADALRTHLEDLRQT
ncbi:MAG: protein kinase [Myxococcota bacterium]